MTFEEWFAEDTECSLEGARRYAEKNPHMVKCWQAATLAERERAAKVADDQIFEDHVDCEGCSTAKEIATTIRKGEGV